MGTVGTVTITLNVLPIVLERPYLTYSIYYRGRLSADGNISSETKTQQQMMTELQDMFDHGITNPTVFQRSYDTNLATVMELRKNVGMDTSPIFFHGEEDKLGNGTKSDAASLTTLKQKVANLKNLMAGQGFTDLYIYGVDEGDPIPQLPAWQAIHDAGAKVFASGEKNALVYLAGNVVDVGVIAYSLDAAEADSWHNYGHKVFLI